MVDVILFLYSLKFQYSGRNAPTWKLDVYDFKQKGGEGVTQLRATARNKVSYVMTENKYFYRKYLIRCLPTFSNEDGNKSRRFVLFQKLHHGEVYKPQNPDRIVVLSEIITCIC
jgi:hypothetical protein